MLDILGFPILYKNNYCGWQWNNFRTHQIDENQAF